MSPAVIRSAGREFPTPDHCADWQSLAGPGGAGRDRRGLGPVRAGEVYEMRLEGHDDFGVIGDPEIDRTIKENLSARIEDLLETPGSWPSPPARTSRSDG